MHRIHILYAYSLGQGLEDDISFDLLTQEGLTRGHGVSQIHLELLCRICCTFKACTIISGKRIKAQLQFPVSFKKHICEHCETNQIFLHS